jgi:hypothetical protein
MPCLSRDRQLRLAPVVVALACLAQPLAGQSSGVLAGNLYDSTAHSALAGATVVLAHAERVELPTRSIVSDSSGHFVAGDLAPGPWMVTFFDSLLNDYALTVVPKRIAISPGETSTVTLVVPGERVLRSVVCGDESLPDSLGVLVGTVRDADSGRLLEGATVTASWRLIELKAGLRLLTRHASTITGADGAFRLCGLPPDEALSIQARYAAGAETDPKTAFESGEIFVALQAEGVSRARISVGPALARMSSSGGKAVRRERGTARLVGQVNLAGGRPRGGARIVVIGAARETTTDGAGRFHLDSLASGSWTVEARAIGYAPVRSMVSLRRESTESTSFEFRAPIPSLERVLVYGRTTARERFMNDFMTRRDQGLGTFFTPDDIENAHPVSLTQLLSRIPGIHLIPLNRKPTLAFTVPMSRSDQTLGSGVGPQGAPVIRGRLNCVPQVFIDGQRVENGADDLDWVATPANVLALEIHSDATGVPPAFGPFTDCLVIGIWTKR